MVMPERVVTLPSITDDVSEIEPVSFDLHSAQGAKMNRIAVDKKSARLLDICSYSLAG
jgi:hypothetical protein